MSESDDLYVSGYTDANQLDPSDTLTGDDTQDPLDAGYTVPERASHSWRGETEDEASRGESLDQHLAEEEPEIWDTDYRNGDADPRSGRLVAPDEGAHERTEADLIASDRGRAGYASSAEEAAIHVIDREDDGEGDNS
jgi:hypothetical protein